ncbi:hypothetical protein D8Y22_06820 [Salinadaptatus halalkaliphilus]|uniref:Uncharacterized protein n=1 Tax=Salinadaptatus halalkaliphilus TaxID=2419781 RepID=A0A4S3TMY8_9EURY|nr:hypothetical protein [Salinadaptatus halalkaliphilus]THE65639.1 hypothetical protein D8Y22_06820 [Salinadaptatus halalkaliphilus]
MLPVISDPESLTAPDATAGDTTGDSSTRYDAADVLADQYRQAIVRYLERQLREEATTEER